MSLTFSWQCPYCNQYASIHGKDVKTSVNYFTAGSNEARYKLNTFVVVCPNSNCSEFTIKADLNGMAITPQQFPDEVIEPPIKSWSLRPDCRAKSFPSYIPLQIRKDYEEACLIASLSPKASATLSRRCLQGMIRDFHGVKEKNLFDEIKSIKNKVDPTIWKAIDSVRSVGNIGAHMEKDIDLIIDVAPNEATSLIALIEMLLKEWYVGRHEREQELQSIIAIGEAKKEARKAPSSHLIDNEMP
jgi:hypothetical protein